MIVSPRRAALLLALVWTGGLWYCLFRMPLPVGDCLDEIVEVMQDGGPIDSFQRALTSGHYLRPLRVMQSRLVFDAAEGHYWFAYRLFHALLVAAAFVLFVRAADVRDRTAFLVLAFALTVLAGHHGFLGNVKEIYPVNHFVEVLVLALAAFDVTRRAAPPWGDAAALAIFAAAVLTLESGLLVWCVVVAARITGLRGVSVRGIALLTAAAFAYAAARAALVEVPPGGIVQATGVGGRVRDVAELREMFGSAPWLLYVYNVAAAGLSVLFSEPRAGVWLAIGRPAEQIPPRVWINIVSSALATGAIAWFVVRRAARWAQGTFDHDDRLVIVFGATLAGTAALSFAYTKNEILGTAAAFYALALFAAVRELVAVVRSRGAAVRSLVVVLLLGTSVLWAVRSAGLFYNLRTQAFTHRNDWASLEELFDPSRPVRGTPSARALIGRLRRQALAMPATNPHFVPRWMERVFDVDW